MTIEFDGSTGQYIAIGSDSTIDDLFVGGGSIAMWLKTDTIGGSNSGRPFDKREGGGGWTLFWTTGLDLVLYHDFSGDDGRWTWNLNLANDGPWHHVLITYNRDATTNDPILYWDGVDQVGIITETTTPTGSADSDAGSSGTIGGDAAGNLEFDGLMEDFRLWKNIVTSEHANQLAAGYRGPIGLEVGWWSMDDFEGLAHPDGTTLTVNSHYLHDKSVNDNRGNPTNGPIARASDVPRMGFGLD